MPTQLKLHKLQSDILIKLLLRRKLRFSELNSGKIPTDKFNFHIQKLVSESLIEKKTDGYYGLTTVGKEFANRFDTDLGVLERQAKVSVLVSCQKYVSKKKYFLMQRRLKEPYYGFLGKITGKIRWGETVYEAAERELKEETGLKGSPKLVGVVHKMDYTKDNSILEDKFFYVTVVKDPKGKLNKKINGGENKWMTEEEVFNDKNTFADLHDIFVIVSGSEFRFVEKKYREKSY